MVGTDSPTVGVIGGGQLARMLGEAAAPLGITIIALDPTPDPPAAQTCRTVTGAFDDEQLIRQIATEADYLTIEIELADPSVLESIQDDHDIEIHPTPDTIRLTRDKLLEKQHLAKSGIPVPSFKEIHTEADLRTAIDEFGLPVMVKARRGGYDGRGNFLVESEQMIPEIMREAPRPLLVEEAIPFDRELSLIAARGVHTTKTFPVGENNHTDEILRETIVPARTTPEIRRTATNVANKVMNSLDGRGVFGIELFEQDGEILVNEIAPRPHNSGHYSIEGCLTSQFAQHLRAVVGYPLGDPSLRNPTVMANILSDTSTQIPAHLIGVDKLLETPGVSFHWYGKREARPLRKMGHITLTQAEKTATTDSMLTKARSLINHVSFTDPT